MWNTSYQELVRIDMNRPLVKNIGKLYLIILRSWLPYSNVETALNEAALIFSRLSYAQHSFSKQNVIN